MSHIFAYFSLITLFFVAFTAASVKCFAMEYSEEQFEIIHEDSVVKRLTASSDLNLELSRLLNKYPIRGMRGLWVAHDIGSQKVLIFRKVDNIEDSRLKDAVKLYGSQELRNYISRHQFRSKFHSNPFYGYSDLSENIALSSLKEESLTALYNYLNENSIQFSKRNERHYPRTLKILVDNCNKEIRDNADTEESAYRIFINNYAPQVMGLLSEYYTNIITKEECQWIVRDLPPFRAAIYKATMENRGESFSQKQYEEMVQQFIDIARPLNPSSLEKEFPEAYLPDDIYPGPIMLGLQYLNSDKNESYLIFNFVRNFNTNTLLSYNEIRKYYLN